MAAQNLLIQFFLACTFIIARCNASLAFTNPSLAGLTAGAPFNLTWSGALGTTTLTLQNGTASNINTVNVVAFGITKSFILWSPYATTPTGTYVLRLDDTSGQSAFSPQFVMLPAGTKPASTIGLQFTNSNFDGVTAGQPFNITWDGASGSTTLTLQNGTGNGIHDVNTIASGITTPYIVWSPFVTTPAGQYVLKLQDTAGIIAYSNIFNLLAVGSSSSSTSSSSSSTTSSATGTQTLASATQTSSSPSQTTSSTSSSSQTSSSAPTLSTGAKVGIGIGATVGGLAIISTIVLLYLRYKIVIEKKAPSGAGGTSSGTSITSFGMPSMGYEKGVVGSMGEGHPVGGGGYAPVPPAEMGAAGENRHPVEMQADRGAHELGIERWR